MSPAARLHPRIALSSLLTLALALSLAQGAGRLALLLIVAVILLHQLARHGRALAPALWPALRRVRWLLLALLLLPLWWLPTAASPELILHDYLAPAAGRVLALLALVIAAAVLQASYARDELVAALAGGGRWRRRLVLRLWLVLEALPAVEASARQVRRRPAAPRTGVRGRLAGLAATLGDWLGDHLAAAHGAGPDLIELPRPQPVPAWQWSVPVLLLLPLVLAWPGPGG